MRSHREVPYVTYTFLCQQIQRLHVYELKEIPFLNFDQLHFYCFCFELFSQIIL